jgi:hypothetical protein
MFAIQWRVNLKPISSIVLASILLLGIGLLVTGKVCSIQFERNCRGYLKHAADANTIALAEQELSKAVSFLEANGLTSGSTHAFYFTPACDLKFWYQNLHASREELRSLPTDVDPLTASNQLLKLRETLVDQGEKGARVTLPPNISIYPAQQLFSIASVACVSGLFVSLVVWAHESGGNCESNACQ